MAEIHPLAFIIVGMVVTTVSAFVGLTFFMYAGIIFMVWGIGKISFKKLTEPKVLKRTGYVHKEVGPAPEHYYVHCTRCGHRVRPADAFCPSCGLRRSRV
jgi:hypothetical protein